MLGWRNQLFEKLFWKRLFFLSEDEKNYMADHIVDLIHQTLIVQSTILASQALGVPRNKLSFKDATKFLP